MPRTACLLLVLAATVLASTAAARQDPAPEPATVKDVMVTMTVPASDVIFEAASEPPRTDAQWAALRQATVTLAESGRLLTRPGLARDASTWMELARTLVDAAEATRTIAEAKKGDALERASDAVYATCETCHARYLEPVR